MNNATISILMLCGRWRYVRRSRPFPRKSRTKQLTKIIIIIKKRVMRGALPNHVRCTSVWISRHSVSCNGRWMMICDFRRFHDFLFIDVNVRVAMTVNFMHWSSQLDVLVWRAFLHNAQEIWTIHWPFEHDKNEQELQQFHFLWFECVVCVCGLWVSHSPRHGWIVCHSSPRHRRQQHVRIYLRRIDKRRKKQNKIAWINKIQHAIDDPICAPVIGLSFSTIL